MPGFVWLGDEDPSAQVITHHGHRFVKGEPTNVTDKAIIAKLKANTMFAEGKGDVVESQEPPLPDLEEGREIAAVRGELDQLGVKYAENAKIETLRHALAAATKKAD